MQFWHRVKIIGGFGKWVIITILGALVAGVAAGEAILKVLGWIVRGGRP